jgi:hypothetical protein
MRLIVAFVLLNAAFGGTPTPKHQRSLSHIAVRILRDVLKGDKDVLLRYEDTALQQKRREELRDPRNLLYCHVFDESCSDWKNGSVKKQMDKWKSPAYKVVYNGIDTAVVYFYDRRKVDVHKLDNADYVCKHGWVNIFSWRFVLRDGRWQTANLPFDDSSDSLCSTEDS